MRKSLWILPAICLLLSAARAEAVMLRYNLKKDDTARYREMSAAAFKVTSGMGGQLASFNGQQINNGIYRETVTEVTPEGVIILIRSLESGKTSVRMSGQENSTATDMPRTKTVIRMTPRGRILSARTGPAEPSAEGKPEATGMSPELFGMDLGMLEAVLSHPPLPEGEVKPNDTWTEEVRLPGFMDSPTVTVTLNSRLLALAPYKGRDCAKIRTFFQIPLEMDLSQMMQQMPMAQGGSGDMQVTGKLSGAIEWQFDYKRGQLVYGEGPLEMVATTNFTVTQQTGTTSGSAKLALKSNQKVTLLE